MTDHVFEFDPAFDRLSKENIRLRKEVAKLKSEIIKQNKTNVQKLRESNPSR